MSNAPLMGGESRRLGTFDGLVARMRSLLADYKTIVIPAACNVSASYNICNVGYAVQLMRLEHPVPRWAAPAFSSSCLFGSIVGQLALGYAGDRIGRRPAMMITLLIIAVGALCSAIFTTGFGDDIWQRLVFWRFVLGVGVGGTYPLGAVYAGEMSDARGLGRTSRVAYSIALQIVGNILAPLLLLVVVLCLGADRVTGEEWFTETGWRLLLGLGCVPSLLALREFAAGTDVADLPDAREGDGSGGGLGGWLEALREAWGDQKLRRRLVGASAGWLCFDVCFFGVAISLPHVTHALVDKEDRGREMLLLSATVSCLINCLAVPAALLSIRLVADDSMGRKGLQQLSFALIAFSYGLLFLLFPSLRGAGATGWLVLLLSSLFFSLNFGAGLTTYILPQESFPRHIRASLNGVAAAAGKAGGVLSAYCFAPMARSYGLAATFLVLGCFAAAGGVVTARFVDDVRGDADYLEGDAKGRERDAPSAQRRL